MGDLMIKDNELVALTNNAGLDEVLKPLVKEIFLFDTRVAGTTHIADKSVFDEIREGDKLSLRREENKFDEKAIAILTQSGKKIGYVPETDNAVFSRLMDAGKMLSAAINSIKNKGDFRLISISIFLLDF
ncbi:MAG: HIRAN domain-containing protein [Ruminococcus sp.]|nr:HIRAN domain-containing protein [Ruminococcus sp.]